MIDRTQVTANVEIIHTPSKGFRVHVIGSRKVGPVWRTLRTAHRRAKLIQDNIDGGWSNLPK